MGKLVKLLGSGIGLAQEALAARKEEKARTASRLAFQDSSNNGESSSAAAARPHSANNYEDDAPPQYAELPDEQADVLIAAGKAVAVDSKEGHDTKVSTAEEDDEDEDTASEEGDEDIWDLDDAVDAQMSHPPSNDDPTRDPDALVDEFVREHQPPPYSSSATPRSRLPCTVVIPQRRPRDKKRGFVRAYAPVLNEVGIDQATFLDFLKTFYMSSKSSPYLQVINVAAMIAGNAPSVIAMGVSIGVQVACGVAMEVQSRSRSNTFLDRMNNEFFKPHGVYCLIITYKPESTDTHASVDITKAVHSSMTPRDSSMKNAFKNLRLSDGKTYGELEMPEAAPLVFPALEHLVDPNSTEEIQKSNKMKSTQKFFADYSDRRAQAKYAAEHPDSVLVVPEDKKFASKYSDPNHAANSGSLISLVTGGRLNPRAHREQRRAGKRVARAMRRGQEVTPEMMKGKRREGRIKKMLKKDVLYMMIVNLPSEDELAMARASIAKGSK